MAVKKASKRKTVKAKQIQETHGKVPQNKPSTLNEVIYGQKFNAYFTEDIAEYEKYVRGISKSDLYDHARQIGVVPSDNRTMLERNLINRFAAYHSGTPSDNKRENPGVPAEIEGLLSRGR